jgi:SnoaL-like protein
MGTLQGSRRVRRWCSVSMVAAVVAAGVPLAAWAAGDPGDEGRISAAEESMVAAARRGEERFRELWNADKLDQLVAEIYTDESVVVPPNHEPVRGRAAIREFLQPVRYQLGEFSKEDYSCHPTSSEKVVSMFCLYKFRSGTLQYNAHEAWQRQPDGSVRNMVDMFGSR